MVDAPWSPTYTRPWGTAQDAQGHEVKRMRLWNVSDTITVSMGSGTGTGNVPDGLLAFRTTSSQRRLNFTDTGADVIVPRLDYAENCARWSFTTATGNSPFVVASTTVVTNLNADLLDGYNTSTSETADTVAVRTSLGRLKCADPSSGTDVVNYQSMISYVSGVVQPHAAAKYTTTAALPSFTATGTPKVLTATANGALGVDSNTPAVNDRIGVVYETGGNQKYNGLYIVTTVGTAGTPWVLTRSTDADTSAELPSGSQWWTTSGTVNGGSSWILTTPDPITLDTTALTFVQNGGTQNISAGNGIDKTGNVVSVMIGASTTYTAGAIVYAATTTTLSGAQLTGILKGNGASAPTAVTGTVNVMAKWGTSGTTLTTSSLTDDGSTVSTTVDVMPSADSARNLGSTSLAWLATYSDQIVSTNGTGASVVQHTLLRTTGTRWAWGLKGIESGSNVGSSLVLTSYTDAGSAATEVLTFNRATGTLILAGLGNSKVVTTNSSGEFVGTTTIGVANGGTGTSSFTTGSIIFSNGTILTQDNANFYWDDANNRLGVGTNAPISIAQFIDGTNIFGGPPNGTTSTQGLNIGATGTNTTLNLGIDATGATNYTWIQSRSRAAATYLSLVLQPSGGKVGVGTNMTVSAQLHVRATTEQLRLDYDSTHYNSFTTDSGGGLSVVTTTNGNINLLPQGTGTVCVGSSASVTNGSLGVAQFQVEKVGAYSHTSFYSNVASVDGSYVGLWKSRGTSAGSMTIVAASDILGGIWFGGADGVVQRLGARIEARVDGTPASNHMPTRLAFFTGAGSGAATLERLSVWSDGKVTIGPSMTAAAQLHVRGTAEQFRLEYDATHYTSFTVSSAGSITIAPVSTQNIVLATASTGNVQVTNTTTSSSTTTGSLVNSGGFGNAGKGFFGDSVNITTVNTQLLLGYDATFKHTFVEDSSGQLTVAPATGVKTAAHIATSFTTACTSSTASVELTALYAISQGSNTQGTNYGFKAIALNGQTSVAGYFISGFSSGTSSIGIHAQVYKQTGGSETDLYAVKGVVEMGSSAGATTGSSFYATSVISAGFTSFIGFNFAPVFSATPTGTSVYGAKLDSAISGATIATNYALYVNATGGTANYAIYIAAGNVNFNALTASAILQLDASKNVTSSTNLPAGITIGGLALTRKVSGSITWSLSGAEYICDITTGLGSDDVMVEVYDGSANKATWFFEIRRPSSGLVRIVADVNFGSGYRYVITG